MKTKELKGIIVKTNVELTTGVAFCKFLSINSMQNIKLPTIPEKYKYKHLLQPNYLLEIEVIKTRKNWVVKNILKSEKLLDLKDYSEYLKYSEIVNYLEGNIKDEQETNILVNIINLFQNKSGLKLSNLEIFKYIDNCLGF